MNNLTKLSEESSDIRKAIIKNLGKSRKQYSDELNSILNSAGVPRDLIISVMSKAEQDSDLIASIRYELEDYKNNLDPEFSESLLEKYNGKTLRVLDLGAGPGDVTIKCFQKLSRAGIDVSVSALESSANFRNQILENSRKAGIISQLIGISNDESFTEGVNPVAGSIQQLNLEILDRYDLIVGNYVLDRVDQVQLLGIISEAQIPYMQFVNCVPLQYSNPETGKTYVPENQRIISEGAESLKEIGRYIGASGFEQFFGKNIVDSLQDGEEKFRYAGIRINN